MSKSKSTWADVKKHDLVELSGRQYRVVKIKPKGKKAAVTVEIKGKYFDHVVKLKDRVKIAKANGGSKKGPLADENGDGRRWATKREAEEVLGKGGADIPRGDPSKTKPPKKPTADPWTDPPKAKVDTMLGELLNARLVGETPDEKAGYYVPPVDVSTVASHLALFHGGIPPACEDEGSMLKAHESQHAEALRGTPLAVNHWHTQARPKM